MLKTIRLGYNLSFELEIKEARVHKFKISLNSAASSCGIQRPDLRQFFTIPFF
jgi:hypothetical protein